MLARYFLRHQFDCSKVDFSRSQVNRGDSILAGERPGRTSDDEIITFLSPGIGFCDIAVARWMFDLSEQHGIGEVAWRT